jgi:hypothetical protein
MDQEYINILEDYVSGVDGLVLTGTPVSDLKLQLDWTQSTWEDGIPVNKYFSRCERQLKVTLKAGVEISGAWYRGRSSGCHMFTFRLNDTWYEAKREDAEEILQTLGHDPDEL